MKVASVVVSGLPEKVCSVFGGELCRIIGIGVTKHEFVDQDSMSVPVELTAAYVVEGGRSVVRLVVNDILSPLPSCPSSVDDQRRYDESVLVASDVRDTISQFLRDKGYDIYVLLPELNHH